MHPSGLLAEEAMLLQEGIPGREAAKLTRLLQFFGVQSRSLTVHDFANICRLEKEAGSFRLICSSAAFLELMDRGDDQRWSHCLHSAFVCGEDGSESLQKLAQRLTRRHEIETVEFTSASVVVTERMKSFCGIMSGLRITPTERSEPVRALVGLREEAESVLSVGTGAVLAKLTYQQLPVFLSAGKTIVDLETELETGIFDLRDYLSPALPIVLYIRWAFPETAWHSPEINACLVIDDPVLKRSHGFVNFAQLLLLMKRHRFSTNIAFIPWNWRRSDPKVARLFAENPELYSLSVHGCDHTRAEFGGGDRQQLDSRIRRAIRRMDHHEERTGIRHDRVMVFPQGVFSTEAMTALKRSELIAAVNNDTISADPRPSPVTIADVWQIALMNYGNFALFTRRYPWEGLENFAFDALLGKPAIIIVHHDSCRDDCKALTEFVDRFNSLESAPAWRSLGEVVRRSCRQRQISEDAVEVTMYASELRLENRSNQPKRFQLQRTEPAVSSIARITRDSEPLAWSGSEGRIFGELELDAGEAARIRIEFQSSEDEREEETDIVYEARTMLRRYVCEARDNYLTKYKLMLKSVLGANREKWN